MLSIIWRATVSLLPLLAAPMSLMPSKIITFFTPLCIRMSRSKRSLASAPKPPGTVTRLLPMPRFSTPWLVILCFSCSISDITSGHRFWALSVEHLPSVMELPMMAMALMLVLIVYTSIPLMLYQWFSRKAFSKLEWALVTPFMI
ncbi:Uncharacterised protein [Segatella copri]|nr:Uncharacterised protein [Segatella copri]